MTDNLWRIESRQKRVGGLAAHNYLALVAPDGTVVEEIHGDLEPDSGLLKKYGKGHFADKSTLNPEVEDARTRIAAGDEGGIRNIWSGMDRTADEYSRIARYGALGPNSNSFWGTVLDRTNYPRARYHPSNRLLTPGSGIDLGDPKWRDRYYDLPGREGIREERSDIGADLPQVAAEFAGIARYDGYARGGIVRRGAVAGDPPGPDDVFIAVQAGEGVLPRQAMAKLGPLLFALLNAGEFDRDAVLAALRPERSETAAPQLDPETARLPMLAAIADLSDDDFAAATAGPRWRRLLAA